MFKEKFYNHFCSRNRFLTLIFVQVLLFESWNCRIFVETFLWCIFMFWRLKSGKQEVLGTPWTTAPNYGHFSFTSQQELHHQPSTSNNGFFLALSLFFLFVKDPFLVKWIAKIILSPKKLYFTFSGPIQHLLTRHYIDLQWISLNGNDIFSLG